MSWARKASSILDRIAADPNYEAGRKQYVRAGRLGEATEIAELAYYLAATDATFMQGTDLVIDGGYITH